MSSISYLVCPISQLEETKLYGLRGCVTGCVGIHSLSAKRNIAFAEHGAGRPGRHCCHFLIHSRLDVGLSMCAGAFGPSCKLDWLSDGVTEALVAVSLLDDAAAVKDDDNGAKTITSVYIWDDW